MLTPSFNIYIVCVHTHDYQVIMRGNSPLFAITDMYVSCDRYMYNIMYNIICMCIYIHCTYVYVYCVAPYILYWRYIYIRVHFVAAYQMFHHFCSLSSPRTPFLSSSFTLIPFLPSSILVTPFLLSPTPFLTHSLLPQAPSQKYRYRFTAALQYDFATHHRRDRMPCKLQLLADFELHVLVLDAEGDILVKKIFDLSHENCRITISPQDVFENRKRRWSKKYPIHLEIGGFELFLFANVSRFKQEWFFRLREAAQGTTTEKLIERQKEFFRYMQRYFPPEPLRHSSLHTGSVSSRSAAGSTSGAQRSARQHPQRRHRTYVDVGAVQFSSTSAGEGEDTTGDGSISISKSHSSGLHHNQQGHSITSSVSSTGTYVSEQTRRPPSVHSLSSTSGPVGGSLPEPPSLGSSDWINALTARLYWDVWHETRWKNWIVSRIQRKLVRIKTPRFLDPLQLTDIAIGDSMPVINRLYEGPFLRPDGVWVYLDVTYEGLFVMTIKTKLKLGHGKEEEEEDKGTEMKSVKHQ